jgi:hypothetical protein
MSRLQADNVIIVFQLSYGGVISLLRLAAILTLKNTQNFYGFRFSLLVFCKEMVREDEQITHIKLTLLFPFPRLTLNSTHAFLLSKKE